MKKTAFAMIIMALLISTTLAVTTNSKHKGLRHDWLLWFENTFIRLIWLPLTWHGFYSHLTSFVCG